MCETYYYGYRTSTNYVISCRHDQEKGSNVALTSSPILRDRAEKNIYTWAAQPSKVYVWWETLPSIAPHHFEWCSIKCWGGGWKRPCVSSCKLLLWYLLIRLETLPPLKNLYWSELFYFPCQPLLDTTRHLVVSPALVCVNWKGPALLRSLGPATSSRAGLSSPSTSPLKM